MAKTRMLFNAIEAGNLQTVRKVLEGIEGVEVGTMRGNYQRTALHQACASVKLRIVKYLIEEQKANVHIVDMDGWTPLYETCRHGDEESTIKIAELLLANGADANTKTSDRGETPLLRACRDGSTQLVQVLLSHGAHVNSKNSRGETPLYDACDKDHVDVIKLLLASKIAELLLANGADANTKESAWGETPLHRACCGGSTQLVQVLLSHGAHVNSKNTRGQTPLYNACDNDHLGVIKLLLASNADRHIKDTYGRGPADVLQEREQKELFESYDKWPLAVSGENIQQTTTGNKRKYTTQGSEIVRMNPRLSHHQHTIGTKALLLVRKLPVYEVAYEILGFLTTSAVEKIFLPTV